MRLIDTHCHIQFDTYDADRDEVIRTCNEKETGVIIVGCEEKSSRDAVALAEKIGEDAWCSVGQHPTDSGEEFRYETYRHLAQQSSKVCAIGECGLDYYHIDEGRNSRDAVREEQKDLFFQHLNLAHELNLPLIVHCRDAYDDMIEMLVHRYGIPASTGMTKETARDDSGGVRNDNKREYGVMHCFTGSVQQAQSYLDFGFLISFTGILTFTDQYNEVVRTVPLDKMLIETDSPFLAPVPHRGKRNSPEYVEHVVRRIAEIKDVPFDDVARATTENAERLFGLS